MAVKLPDHSATPCQPKPRLCHWMSAQLTCPLAGRQTILTAGNLTSRVVALDWLEDRRCWRIDQILPGPQRSSGIKVFACAQSWNCCLLLSSKFPSFFNPKKICIVDGDVLDLKFSTRAKAEKVTSELIFFPRN